MRNGFTRCTRPTRARVRRKGHADRPCAASKVQRALIAGIPAAQTAFRYVTHAVPWSWLSMAALNIGENQRALSTVFRQRTKKRLTFWSAMAGIACPKLFSSIFYSPTLSVFTFFFFFFSYDSGVSNKTWPSRRRTYCPSSEDTFHAVPMKSLNVSGSYDARKRSDTCSITVTRF